MSKKKIQKVSSYAVKMGVSTTTVYNWIDKGRVKLQVIDGVKFVIVENESLKPPLI